MAFTGQGLLGLSIGWCGSYVDWCELVLVNTTKGQFSTKKKREKNKMSIIWE